MNYFIKPHISIDEIMNSWTEPGHPNPRRPLTSKEHAKRKRARELSKAQKKKLRKLK